MQEQEHTVPAEDAPLADEELRRVTALGAVTAAGGRHPIHCLTIIGQVEGHYTLPPQHKTTKYEHVIPQLFAIEQDPAIEGLLVLLNTVGGDVEAGLAIAEVIAGMRKPTVSLVLGGGHSIGVPLAVSARRSLVAPTATMTIHPVRMTGLVLGTTQSDMVRATLEGICLNLRMAMDIMSENVTLSDEMLIVGGGGKSQFWRSLFASIYNKTIIETNVGQDAAALGAAAVAAVGCGLWDSYDRVRDVHERRGAIAPDPADNAVYEALLPVFSKICDIQSDIGDMLQSLELPGC